MTIGLPGAIGIGLAATVLGSGGPLLSLDFTGASLPPGVTLTRASTGTRLTAAGLLASAANDVARFDYDQAGALRGLLIEPAATNVFLRSEEFDNTSWAKLNATVTANAATAPDGTTTAEKFLEDATNGQHRLQQPINVVSGTVYTCTVFAKAAERTWLGIAFSQVVGGNPTSFNLSNGTIGTTQAGHTAEVTPFPNGWYRLRLTVTANATASAAFRFFIQTADNVFSYAGNAANGLFLTDAQHETGAAGTSYIVTTTATVSRAADVLSFTVPAGVTALRFTFDNLTTQDVSVSAGAYTVPTNLNRSRIRSIVSL